jgi:ABC-2 type transport system ATP-binding protein
MRQTVKSLFAEDMAERGLTAVIASHNLRELEDICEHVGLLYQGGILFSRDLDSMKLGMFKVQIVFREAEDEKRITEMFEVVAKEQRGSLVTLTLRGERPQIETAISALTPVFYEVLPLTLEEIFISETEVLGYDFKNIIQ